MTDEQSHDPEGTAGALDEWRAAERALTTAVANRNAAEQAAAAAVKAEEAATRTAEAARAALDAAKAAEVSARATANAAKAVTAAARSDVTTTTRSETDAIADEAGAHDRYRQAAQRARERVQQG